MGLTCKKTGNDSKKNVTEIHYIRRPNCKRRSGDTQSTAHANMRIHKSTSNPDVNTHRPIGSAILRRHELRRERGLRVAQGYWLSTVRREHRRGQCAGPLSDSPRYLPRAARGSAPLRAAPHLEQRRSSMPGAARARRALLG